MQGLRAKVECFKRDVQQFSTELQRGAEDLHNTVKRKPDVGAEEFRESLSNLQDQAAAAQESIAELECSTADAGSLEELLSNCLAQLQDNGKRVENLEAQLKKSGYLTFRSLTPMKEDATLPLMAEIKTGAGKRQLRRSLSSPSLAFDGLSTLRIAESRPALQPLMTPSPMLSSGPSLGSISPGLRELQAKYGQGSAMPTTPASTGGSYRERSPQKGKPSQRADKGSWIAKKLQDRASMPSTPVSKISNSGLESKYLASENQENENHNTGNTIQAVRMSAEDVRPPSTALLTVETKHRQISMTGDTGSAHSYQGNNTPLGKEDVILVRLANGEAPWDMLSLKAAINQAVPGTGDVQKVIESATFHPQAAAFTSLLHMCAKNKLWEKALEVFDGMKKYHPNVVPNTVHFSSLISACGTAGKWREAMQIFEELKVHAKSHPKCAPNVITYSALMTACCSGGRPDKAHSVFQDMIAQGIQPDHISYSTLIAGYERWGDMDTATKLFEEMQTAGLSHTSAGPTSYLEQFSRKIRRTNSNLSAPQELVQSKQNGLLKSWNSFAGNPREPDSPCIAAHFPARTPVRHSSGDGSSAEDHSASLRPERYRRDGMNENLMSMQSLGSQGVVLTPQRTPLPQVRQSLPHTGQGLRGAAGSGRYREIGRSPLSQSYDASLAQSSHVPAVTPPPGFITRTLVPTTSLEHLGSVTKELQRQLGSSEFNQLDLMQNNPAMGGLNSAVAAQMLGALVHQRSITQPLVPPGMSICPQISQVSVEEYNNLPLRFSRQLSLDQMNEAVDYINAVVAGKHNLNQNNRRSSSSSGPIETEGVTPAELISLQLGIHRTTALLNCLLQLQRMRLCVRDEQQFYMLLP